MKKLIIPILTFALLFVLPSCDDDDNNFDNGSDLVVIALPNDFDNVIDVGNAPLPPISQMNAIAAQVEIEIFDRINDFRIGNGLNPLVLDNRISNLLDDHNINMGFAGQNGAPFFGLSHDGFSGRANGVFSFGYNAVGENVAALVRIDPGELAQRFVINWVNSPQHLQNILANVSATGIAVYIDPVTGIVYASQIFAG